MSFAGASGITYSLWSARPCPSARFGQPHGENHLSDSPVISIIDDDESVLVAVRRFVRSLGFIGHTFGSAGEFLHSPHLAETSCVITDIEMPGMSGVELQRVLTARGNNVPIIFITAFPDEEIRTRVLEAGAIGFLSKPFDAATLDHCLGMALGRSRLER